MENHLNRDELVDFLLEEADPDDLQRTQAHLDVCEDCKRRWLDLCRRSGDLDEAMESATAAEFGRVVRQLDALPPLARGLARVARTAGLGSARGAAVYRVLGQLSQGGSLIVRGLLDGTKRLAALAGLQVPPGRQFRLQPIAVGGVGSTEALHQVEANLKDAADSLTQGNADAAAAALDRAAKAHAPSVESAQAYVSDEGRAFTFQVVSDRRQVLVKCPTSAGAVPQSAVLVPFDFPDSPLEAPFELAEGEDLAVAQFDDVPDGAFDITIIERPGG